MTQQVKLTDENFYPTVVEEGDEKVVKFDPEQSVVCKKCGRPMERMAPGPTGSFKDLINEDYLYSCRTPWCGTPYSDGGARAGGSTLRAVVNMDGMIVAEGGIGDAEPVESASFVDDPELGKVHSTYFDPQMYAEATGDDEDGDEE